MESNETQAPETQAPAAADTAEIQDQSEAGDSQVSVPEVSEEAQAETEVKAEDTTQEKLLAGKYKTVEDLEKSYKELESKYGKEASEKAELTRALTEQLTSPAPAVTEDNYYEEPAAAPDDSVKRDLAVMKFIMAHGNADATAMKDILATDPLVSQIQGYEAKLEYAHLKAQAAGQSKAVAQAAKEAKVQTVQKIAEKEIAQVESARKAEPADESGELHDKLTYGTEDERKAARQALIRRNLINL